MHLMPGPRRNPHWQESKAPRRADARVVGTQASKRRNSRSAIFSMKRQFRTLIKELLT